MDIWYHSVFLFPFTLPFSFFIPFDPTPSKRVWEMRQTTLESTTLKFQLHNLEDSQVSVWKKRSAWREVSPHQVGGTEDSLKIGRNGLITYQA